MSDDTIRIDRAAAATGGPGVLTVGGRTLVVRHPTPADYFALYDHARGLAAAECRSPLRAVTDELKDLPAEFHAAIIREAVAQLKGEPTPEPTPEAIQRKQMSHDGVCFFVWWLGRADNAGLTLDAVKALCPPDRVHDLQAALLDAVKLDDKKKAAPASSPSGPGSSSGTTGTGSSAG